MSAPTIFSRFLSELDVPHTNVHSDNEFRKMTFKSLYGLSHLLTEYGVPNEAVKFSDKSALANLPTPFLAQTQSGIFVIVLKIDKEKNIVEYDSLGKKSSVAIDTFINAWNGIALFAYPNLKSQEPDYRAHHLTELITGASHSALIGAGFTVFVYLFITRHIYANISTILLTIFNCIGLYFSYLLLQKSLNIHTAASDRVCGVLEQGGCDSIMQLKVSKLFGVFSWSEVGFGYFSVSLITLLIFPQCWPALAVCNICCLPYTVWSITYQKFVAKHWCTLCVGVQTTLWLLFFCYLGGGWLAKAWPLQSSLYVLLVVYFFTVLLLNAIFGFFQKLPCHENNTKA